MQMYWESTFLLDDARKRVGIHRPFFKLQYKLVYFTVEKAVSPGLHPLVILYNRGVVFPVDRTLVTHVALSSEPLLFTLCAEFSGFLERWPFRYICTQICVGFDMSRRSFPECQYSILYILHLRTTRRSANVHSTCPYQSLVISALATTYHEGLYKLP